MPNHSWPLASQLTSVVDAALEADVEALEVDDAALEMDVAALEVAVVAVAREEEALDLFMA